MLEPISKILRRAIKANLMTAGITLLLSEAVILIAYMASGTESNMPLWLAAVVMAAGTALIITQMKRNSRY